ncbi:MAG: hypothetical protein ACRC2B_01795, partial [Rubrivivax sp.]
MDYMVHPWSRRGRAMAIGGHRLRLWARSYTSYGFAFNSQELIDAPMAGCGAELSFTVRYGRVMSVGGEAGAGQATTLRFGGRLRRLPCDAPNPGLAHNSLRALRALRSNKCAKSEVEARCARGQGRCA